MPMAREEVAGTPSAGPRAPAQCRAAHLCALTLSLLAIGCPVGCCRCCCCCRTDSGLGEEGEEEEGEAQADAEVRERRGSVRQATSLRWLLRMRKNWRQGGRERRVAMLDKEAWVNSLHHLLVASRAVGTSRLKGTVNRQPRAHAASHHTPCIHA